MQKELHHTLLEVQLVLNVFCIVINRYIKPFKEWFKYVKVCRIIKLYSDSVHKLFFSCKDTTLLVQNKILTEFFLPYLPFTSDIPTPKDERRKVGELAQPSM